MDDEKDTPSSNVKKYQNWAIGFIAGGFAVMIGAFVLFLLKTTPLTVSSPLNTSIIGNYGDVIGGITGAFWSLAGVLLFYGALRLQREDLILQRDELRKTREIAEEQTNTFKLQRFENTFFQLIHLHHEIVNNMSIQVSFGTAEGRRCFEEIYHKVQSLREQRSVEHVIFQYMQWYKTYESALGHYFRNLYHVFKFVDQSSIPFPEKHRYANFARAQLSSAELLLLFYNCLSENGKEKFKPLVEKYQILKNMPQDQLIEYGGPENFHPSAFDRRHLDQI